MAKAFGAIGIRAETPERLYCSLKKAWEYDRPTIIEVPLDNTDMTYLSQRIESFPSSTVFSEMDRLAAKYNAINLGHGFPDFAAPHFLKAAAVRAIENDVNQYTSAWGNLKLRQAIAQRMLANYGLSYNPETDITITQGATEAISAAIFGLVNPGDEVILFEPYYSTYLPAIIMAGGIPRFYTFYPPDWQIDEERLGSLFSNQTKLILINTPHNPTGKILTAQEISLLAQLCCQYEVLVISDEVYENLTFDNRQHHPVSSYPDMYERTITVSNLGKTFEVTGWKVGWTIAPPYLTQAILKVRQYSTGSGAAPLQEAAAAALDSSQPFYTDLLARYQHNRDTLYQALERSDFKPILPEGTCFLMADFANFEFEDDVEFCRYLTIEMGVAAIPASALYRQLPKQVKLVRFAFCKQEATLLEAGKRLMQLSEKNKKFMSSP
jgi:N-succinyldiaminopimelate aminotransferase